MVNLGSSEEKWKQDRGLSIRLDILGAYHGLQRAADQIDKRSKAYKELNAALKSVSEILHSDEWKTSLCN